MIPKMEALRLVSKAWKGVMKKEYATGWCQHCDEMVKLEYHYLKTKDILHERLTCTQCGKNTVIWHHAKRKRSIIYGE